MGSSPTEKDAIRRRMRGLRNAMPPEERMALADEVARRLLALPPVAAARTVMLFYAFGSEIPTARMVQRLLDDGRRVLLPYLTGPEMEAAALRPGESLIATTYGPKEPSHRVAVDPEEVDVVVTPGLAFDRHGHRVGYGGGHYDRYLARLRSGATKVAVAFHLQLLPEVPHSPADHPVDFVLTENETIDCALERRGK